MEIQMALYLPRDAFSVPVSRQVLDRCLETLGVTPDTRGDIALALSEACANVIQHAGPGEEYVVRVSTRNCRCSIEVVNAGNPDGELSRAGIGADTIQHRVWPGRERNDSFAGADEPVTAMAEHGRGLQIIDAVVDNLQLTGDERRGTTLHFEKKLEWLPGAAGQHLFNGDAGN
jgi:serine/threonine-protein kinase RsbW